MKSALIQGRSGRFAIGGSFGEARGVSSTQTLEAVAGHYARPEVLSLTVNRAALDEP
jgi:hypothetical protein